MEIAGAGRASLTPMMVDHGPSGNLGATRDEIVQSVSRAFGIRSTSTQVRGVILEQTDKAIAKGELVEQAGMLTMAETQP